MEVSLEDGFGEGIGGEKEKGVLRICLTEQGGVVEVLKEEGKDLNRKQRRKLKELGVKNFGFVEV